MFVMMERLCYVTNPSSALFLNRVQDPCGDNRCCRVLRVCVRERGCGEREYECACCARVS